MTNLVFRSHFNAIVDVVDPVSLDGDVRASITINPIGVVAAPLTRIHDCADVVHRVPANFSVTRHIVSGESDALVPNQGDADVVVVVDNIIGDLKIRDVSTVFTDSLSPVFRL